MKKILLLGILFFILGVGQLAAEQAMPVLTQLQGEIDNFFNKTDVDMAKAASELSKTELKGEDARKILQMLSASNPYMVDCALVNKAGKMIMIEPAEYRKFEGTDISGQAQVIQVKTTTKPVFSKLFKTAEGIEAVDLQYPVFSAKGKFIGAVSMLIKPEAMLKGIISRVIKGEMPEVWVMDTDGRIIYDKDKSLIGRNIITDELYKSYPQLLALGKNMAQEEKGNGSYEFFGRGFEKVVKKDAYWTSTGLHGTQWRIVVIELVYDRGQELLDKMVKASDVKSRNKYRNNLMELTPDSEIGYYARASFIDSQPQPDFDTAIGFYTKAIEMNPKFSYAYVSRAADYVKKGLYNEAIDDSNKAIELNQDFPPAYVNRGEAYYYKGQYDEAIKDTTKAIMLAPKLAAAYNVRGLAYNKKTLYKEAVKDYSKAISLDATGECGSGEKGQAYLNRAEVYQAMGNEAAAKADLKKAGTLSKK
jgi:tetratricopeptide (TPR) repeat protein